MDNYIGRLLDDRYEILEVIGTGGMAVVYKARCHRLNRMVAIKVLKDELSQDAEFRRRFHAESQAVAMLSHPNIVNVYDVSHSQNTDYIVMELIDGITLKQYMEQKGTLNWREVLHFSTQIGKALEHAHSRGIIHRDIKPHNIMILKDGSIKVADFGIARVSSAQSTLTREALGSVHYISPEQAKGGKIDYRSDLYSLGVVMYEMLTGRPPYDGETPVAVAIQHINANAKAPREWNSQIPVGLEQITMHAMAADLEQRYETASVMLMDLDEFRKNPSVTFDFSGEADLPAEAVVAEHTDAERAVRAAQGKDARHSIKKKRTESNAAAVISGVICILLALAAIGYFLYSFFLADLFTVPEDVEVPALVNQVAEELNFADYPDLDIVIAAYEPSETVEAGKVLSQSPVEGRKVKPGAKVELTVSSGPAVNTMPDLINQTDASATTLLGNLPVKVEIVRRYETSDLYAGTVYHTEPEAKQPLSEGQTVVLYISSGPDAQTITMNRLVGMTLTEAEEWLDDNDLLSSVTYVESEEEADVVVYQSIAKGERLAPKTVVYLQVSKGEREEFEDDPLSNGLPQSHLIRIPMPEGDETVTVTIKVDDKIPEDFPPFEVELVTLVDNSCPIALKYQGVRVIDVYLDDILWHSMAYDFDTGEVVE